MDKGKRYVIGDIHGCIVTLRKLVEEKIGLAKEDTLFLLGDYIDRGPDSKAVVDYIMDLKDKSFRVVPLVGNHEYMLLQSLDDSEYFDQWMGNGNATTLRSFGIPEEMITEWISVRQIPGTYIRFFRELAFYAETDGFFIVHAGLGNETGNPLEDAETLLWSRAEKYNKKILKNRRLIHGHTPISLESIKDRIYDPDEKFINLDGGCVYKQVKNLGNLVGLELETMTVFVQGNID